MTVKSDGGSTPDLYGFPAGLKDFTRLCDWRGMNPYQYNIAKAAWRWGGKEGTDLEYDLRKIIYFAGEKLKELNAVKGMEGVQPVEEAAGPVIPNPPAGPAYFAYAAGLANTAPAYQPSESAHTEWGK